MIWMEMAFLGDSLTSGSRDKHGLSWVYRMCHLALREDVTIVPQVNAVAGRTSSELVRDALPIPSAKELFLLIGTNDSKDHINTPTDILINNMLLVVNWALIKDVRVYVMTIPVPVGFGSQGYTRKSVERIIQYNKFIRDCFGNEKIPNVFLIDCVGHKMDTVDGVHLSESTANYMARLVWDFIKNIRTMDGKQNG